MHKIIMFLKALALVFLISSIATAASAKTLGIIGQTARLKNDILAAARPHLTEEDARHLKAGWLIPVINVPLKTTIWSAAHDFVVSGGQTSSVVQAPAPVVVPVKPQAASRPPVATTTAKVTAPVSAPVSKTAPSTEPAMSLSMFSTNSARAPQATEAPEARQQVIVPDIKVAPPVHTNWWTRQLNHLSDVWTWSTGSIPHAGVALVTLIFGVCAVIFIFVLMGAELEYGRNPDEYDARPIKQVMNALVFWRHDAVVQTEAEDLPPQQDAASERMSAAAIGDVVLPADTGNYRESSRTEPVLH